MPQMYIISGCNGSGKTTASYTVLPEMLGCKEFVNSDEFAKGLSPFHPEAVSVAASRHMLQKITYLIGKNSDFALETTLATRSLLKIIRSAQDRGYEVTVLYFWVKSPELAIARIRARVAAGGHDIPETTVRRRYYVGLHYLFTTYISVCDRWILADNSEIPFTVVAEGDRDRTTVLNEQTWERIRQVHEEYAAEVEKIIGPHNNAIK